MINQQAKYIVQVELKDGRKLECAVNKDDDKRQKVTLYDQLESVKDDFVSAIVTYQYPDKRIPDNIIELNSYEELIKELSEKFI